MPAHAPALAGLAALIAAAAACAQPAPVGPSGGAAPSTFPTATTAPDAGAVRVEVVAEGLENPWGLAFLPDGRMLVTEKRGGLRLIGKDGVMSAPLAGVPPVEARRQGGLLGVAIDPAFAANRRIYIAFSEKAEGGAVTAVARGVLADTGLTEVAVIYRQDVASPTGAHFGSRLVFGRDGTLFVTQGDRYLLKDEAQNLSNLIGKIVRINTDGSIPKDNPFVGKAGARPEIWSYGHRNVQGAILGPDGALWTAEHGAQGGDEVNRPQAGRNYGWPVITYGKDYGGASIGEGVAKTGLEQPLHYWDPSIAPSGLTFYTGSAFPAWKGDLFVGSLKFAHLARLDVENGRVVGEHRYLQDEKSRIRDVVQGPDGFLYVLTDSPEGRLLRLRPAG